MKDFKVSFCKVLLNAPITPSCLFGESMEFVIECFSEAQEARKGDESPYAAAHVSFTCICIVFPLLLQVKNARFCNVSVQ